MDAQTIMNLTASYLFCQSLTENRRDTYVVFKTEKELHTRALSSKMVQFDKIHREHTYT